MGLRYGIGRCENFLGVMPTEPAKRIDCLGLFCPMPVVRTREAIREMAVGEVLEMIADDPASDADMQRWAQRTGHELLEVTRDATVYRFLVRKTR